MVRYWTKFSKNKSVINCPILLGILTDGVYMTCAHMSISYFRNWPLIMSANSLYTYFDHISINFSSQNLNRHFTHKILIINSTDWYNYNALNCNTLYNIFVFFPWPILQNCRGQLIKIVVGVVVRTLRRYYRRRRNLKDQSQSI